MPINKAFGRWVRELAAGQDQGEVAERLGISQAYVSRIQAGTVPSLEMLEKIADTFGVSVAEVRERAGVVAGQDPLEEVAERAARRALELAGIGSDQRVLAGQSGADVLLEGLYELMDRYPAVKIPVPRMKGGIRNLTVEAAEKILADMKEMVESGELGELNAMRPGRGGY